MAAKLEKRLEALEEAFQPPVDPVCILITGMAAPGHRWVPNVFTLAGGKRMTRGEQSPEEFAAAVTAAALAALPSGQRVALATCIEGAQVPEAMAAQMWPNPAT